MAMQCVILSTLQSNTMGSMNLPASCWHHAVPNLMHFTPKPFCLLQGCHIYLIPAHLTHDLINLPAHPQPLLPFLALKSLLSLPWIAGFSHSMTPGTTQKTCVIDVLHVHKMVYPKRCARGVQVLCTGGGQFRQALSGAIEQHSELRCKGFSKNRNA